MVIVGGAFEFDPELRDKFIESRGDMIRTSRGEAGCIEYTFAQTRSIRAVSCCSRSGPIKHRSMLDIAAQRAAPTTDRARHSTDLVVDHALTTSSASAPSEPTTHPPRVIAARPADTKLVG